MLTTLTVTTPTDREIVMIRIFNAPRRMVWPRGSHRRTRKEVRCDTR